MLHRIVRITFVLLAGFVALTAIGGGVAMLAGVDQFPLAWLAGTPFADFTIPALILAVVVGGSALAALVLALRRSRYSAPAGIAAGVLLAGFIGVEVLILKQTPPGPTPIEIFYFAAGALMLAAAAALYFAPQRSSATD